MRNISMVVRDHYDDDRYMWVRRFCDTFKNTTISLVPNISCHDVVVDLR
jgi:hypothetical protein